MSHSVELVLDAKADAGEGALWDAKRQVLYWVNIARNELHIYDPVSGHDRSIDVGQNVNTVVPRRSGGVMLGARHGFASLDLETDGHGNVVVDAGLATTAPAMFAAGDCAMGASLVVRCISQGRRAAAAADRFLRKK